MSTVSTASAAVTRPTGALPGDLIAAIPDPTGALCLVCGGDGLVGWGEHARFAARGPDAAQRIGAWFTDVMAGLDVDDAVSVPGSGPVAFVSMGFGDDDTTVAVVPTVVLGRRDGVTFTTVIGDADLRSPTPITAPGLVTFRDGSLPVYEFVSIVSQAAARIRAGGLGKVVLAHDLLASTEHPVDERFLLRHLASSYPTCFTFAVDGLVGASPEMLVRRIGRRIGSRVLAGTAWPEHAGDPVSAELLASSKDRSEHEFAVSSVADALAAVCSTLTVPTDPQPLELANLTHLATEITGVLDGSADAPPTALDLAALLHPSAAVGGTPTEAAVALIGELEPQPRERYAAPVGWMDAAGDGEFAIALRCADVDGRSVRLIAGCGIVADSDPLTEAREAQIKMLPVRNALQGQ